MFAYVTVFVVVVFVFVVVVCLFVVVFFNPTIEVVIFVFVDGTC